MRMSLSFPDDFLGISSEYPQEYLIVLNISETFNTKFIDHFYTTFGLTLRPQTPMMFLEAQDSKIEPLTQCGLSGFRARALPLT